MNPNEIVDVLTTYKTIAIVGLSPKPERDSYKVAKYLQEVGYRIIPVYPREEMILGERVYRNLDEVKESIAIVNVFLNASLIEPLVEQINARDDIQVVWSQLGIYNDAAYAKLQNKKLILVAKQKTHPRQMYQNRTSKKQRII